MDESPVPNVALSPKPEPEPPRRWMRTQANERSPSGALNESYGVYLGPKKVQPPSSIGPDRLVRRSTIRKRLSEAEVIDEAMKPLTDEERRAWKGWCELESDPALFNFILREYGIKDIKVQEVLGLEDEMFHYLPKPVYGLVFLFGYKGEDSDAEELPKCPNNVWFANQTTHNACATIALMNIVMNVPELDLGESIAEFKEATQHLKPAYRGQELSQNGFIRNIHNSFARRMDILNADLALSNEVTTWNKRRKTNKKKGKGKLKPDEEPSFHFIAFVPVGGVVWRLDGLQHRPVSLGEYEDDWISLARANIYDHIAKHDNGLQYNLLSLCRSPLATLPTELAQNIHAIRAVEDMLSEQMTDWRNFNQAEALSPIKGPCETFGVSDQLLLEVELSPEIKRMLGHADTDASKLLQMLQQLGDEQSKICTAYMEEVSSLNHENDQAARRKEDHTPLVYQTVRVLADKGVLKEIMEGN